jgi:hypothetical protein
MALTVVKLDSGLVAHAKTYGEAANRSTAKQVEYWARIGKIAQYNSDLSYKEIAEILCNHALSPQIGSS